MAVTALILAGGKSRRMGGDKALMFGSVARLQQLVREIGLSRCVVLCGDASRQALFTGEVMIDPPETNGLHQLLPRIRDEIGGCLLLLPCDAFLISKDALVALLSHRETGGIPLDEHGVPQPLFAIIPGDASLVRHPASVQQWLESLPLLDVKEHASAYSNFNSPADLEHHQLRFPEA